MRCFALLVLSFYCACAGALQSWSEQPHYQEVNPHGDATLPCVVNDMRGQCRWEKDGTPVGIFPGKYEWAGSPESGDCSLRVLDAELKYDDGVWQCQVTPSSFQVKDALISEGAQLVVRESPTRVFIQKVGDESSGANVTASAGEDVELECVVEGGNPPAVVQWFAGGGREMQSGHTQEDTRSARTWTSLSRLTLPVSRTDDGSEVRCEAAHPTLEAPLVAVAALTIHYPPTVKIETSTPPSGVLEDKKDQVTLKCVSDANPPASVTWRKQGMGASDGVFSSEETIVFSPVSRHTGGVYSCQARNQLGLSEPDYVDLDVKYTPNILAVGPSSVVEAKMSNTTVLTCEAEGNPEPKYQWLQKLPSNQVLIRGYSKTLVIDSVSYDHQGEFVCKAVNVIRGEQRSVQSKPIEVRVSGAPQVTRYKSQDQVRVGDGQDALLRVTFCADPLPKQAWHLSDARTGDGKQVILGSGTTHGRFVAESARPTEDGRRNCYVSALRINGAHAQDSHAYQLRLSNEHGEDAHTVNLVVRDHVSNESLIAVGVGAILTVLLLIVMVMYCCNFKKCCCGCGDVRGGDGASDSSTVKKDFKHQPHDVESDRTDEESTHSSSNLSAYPPAADKLNPAAVIPPDALYATSEKYQIRQQQQQQQQQPSHYVHGQYSHDALFNDSQESLRPDLISPPLNSASNNSNVVPMMSHSNLNRTSSSGSGDMAANVVSYDDLCFPKTSNYGSMKKKKKLPRNVNFGGHTPSYMGHAPSSYDGHAPSPSYGHASNTSNVGVDCRLAYAHPPRASGGASSYYP